MNKPLVKFIIGMGLGLCIALLVAFNCLLVWVATGPRSLDNLTTYIEQALEPADHSYSVSIGHTWLAWDGWQHPLDLRLRDISITHEGQLFSHFPEISLGVDAFSLPLGRILPTSITITHPVISLFQNDDRSISFGFRKEENAAVTQPPQQAVPLANALAPLIAPERSSNLRKLHNITILDAYISVEGAHKGVFFKTSNANILFRRDWHGVLRIAGNSQITYSTYESQLSADFTLQPDESIVTGTLGFNKLMPGLLATLFLHDSPVSGVSVPLSGKATLSLDLNGEVQHAHFMVDGGKGSITTDKLEGTLPVTALHVEGDMKQHFQQIDITSLTATLDGMELAAKGNVTLDKLNSAINGDASLKNATAANLPLLWPPSVSPESRTWVVGNILEGAVPLAKAHIAIAAGDLAKPVLPKEDVDASITLEKAKIRYLPEHPPISNVKGTVHVDGISLKADIASGDYMSGTKMTNGTLLIDNLNADNPYIKVGFDAVSPATDIVRFLGLPRLNHAKRLNLTEEGAQGNTKGSATVGFHFFVPKDANGKSVGDDDVTYDVKGEVSDLTQPGFMKKFDISHADGSFTVNNAALEFKGKAEVNGASVSDGDVRYLFTPDKGFDTFIDVTAIAPVESLPRFGYPDLPFLKGKLGIEANIKQGEKTEAYKATIDLTNAAIDQKTLVWNKPAGEGAKLILTAEKKDGIVTIPSFQISGKDMAAKGSAALDANLADFSHIVFDSIKHGNTDLDSFSYDTIEGGLKLALKGRSADASPWVESDDKEESTFSFEHFPALEISADVGRLVTGKDRLLTEVKADVQCDVQLCHNVNVSGATADKKPFAVRIMSNPKGTRQFSLHAQSAGAFLKAVNVFDGMEGGDLTITGNYNDAAASSTLAGRVDISEYTVHNAPILGKILSLASFTGIFDTLQGNGIRFDRMNSNFNLTHDVITVEGDKTHGSAIGMTLDGTITYPKKTLDLQGTIVPAYTLNHVLSNVPLVGGLLTGGDGQGVFAARYSVKGEQKNPEVSVNPLSILTPGFLRGLFDILDSQPKKPPEETE